jgi:hypothetical protein
MGAVAQGRIRAGRKRVVSMRSRSHTSSGTNPPMAQESMPMLAAAVIMLAAAIWHWAALQALTSVAAWKLR